MRFLLQVIWLVLVLQVANAALNLEQQALLVEGDRFAADWDNRNALTRYAMVFAQDSISWDVNLRIVQATIDTGEDSNGAKKETLLREGMRLGERFTTLFPDSSQTWLLTAIAYGHVALLEGGREKVRLSRDVERNLLNCLELEPDSWRARGILGKYYMEIADLNWALKVIAKSLMGGLPDGTLAMAERELQHSLRLYPNYVYARLQLGRTWLLMDKTDQAITELERAVNLTPRDHMDPVYQQEANQLLQEIRR